MSLEEELEMRYRNALMRCGFTPGDDEVYEEEEETEGIEMGDIDAYGPKPELFGKGVKFERIRRITGYLVGDVGRWNNGKKAELRDRVRHS